MKKISASSIFISKFFDKKFPKQQNEQSAQEPNLETERVEKEVSILKVPECINDATIKPKINNNKTPIQVK